MSSQKSTIQELVEKEKHQIDVENKKSLQILAETS